MSHRKKLVDGYTEQIFEIHTSMTNMTRQHHKDGNDEDVVKLVGVKRKERNKLAIETNELDVKYHDYKGELGEMAQA